MTRPAPQEVSQLLQAWCHGDRGALDQLVPIVYDELHRMARRYMAHKRAGNTLQTTALINEAYLRLIDIQVEWQNRAHFFAISANVMRHILVDLARNRGSQKRGGNLQKICFDIGFVPSAERAADLVALDDALEALAALDPRKAKVIELRFFGGLTPEETAEVLQVSPETVFRDWRMAKVWLLREMQRSGAS